MASSIRESATTDTLSAGMVESPSQSRQVLAHLLREEVVALAILVIIISGALFAPWIGLDDPEAINKGDQFHQPSIQYPFGTDEFGRDILSRTVYAGRISLATAVVAVSLATLFGVPLGLISGYAGRWVDTVVMRLMDVLLSFPAILLAMAVVAVLGPNWINASLAVALVSIPTFARIARAAMLTQKAQDYVEASRSVGATHTRIIFRTILPNCLPPILVQMTIAVGFAILLEAALSFLGLGTQPPTPSWGTMLQVARSHLRRAWWYGFFPGLFVTLLILALNAISDSLRDALDPAHTQ